MATTRRGFFKAILGAAAAGTLMTDSKVVQALTMFADDPIAISVRKARDLIAMSKTFMLENESGYSVMTEARRNSQEYTDYLVKGDDLIDYMLGAFKKTPTNDEMDLLFNGYLVVEELSEDAMRKIAEEIVPVAIIRLLVQVSKQPFHMSRMKSFMRFADVYRDCIMGTNWSVAVRSIMSLKVDHLTAEQKGELVRRYYAARDAGKLGQKIEISKHEYPLFAIANWNPYFTA